LKFQSEEELTEWVLESRRTLLFLDYDGTLADFVPTPDIVIPDPEIISLLQNLVKKPGFQVVIISGRRLIDLRKLAPVPGIYIAGTYGLELCTPTGEIIERADMAVIRPVLEKIKPQWEQIIFGKEGYFLEDKGWTLAIHARFAEEGQANQVLTQARRILNQEIVSDQFYIMGGKRFLEIAPINANKKETVLYLLKQVYQPETRLLYLGDDDKDELAFNVIHQYGGTAIKVISPAQTSQPSQADYTLGSAHEAIRWLSTLDKNLPDPKGFENP
jgi:trehalose-phosphatase